MSKLPAVLGAPELASALAANPEIRLVDVRTTSEFARTSIEGSFNVPLHELEPHAPEIATLRSPVVIVCRSGARARTAIDLLQKRGIRSVHLLDGGLIAWRRHGLPVQRRRLSSVEMVRRAIGVAGLVLAAVVARENPLVGLMFAVVGVRLTLGQPVLPCAAAGTCTVPGADTAATVRSLLAGQRQNTSGPALSDAGLAGG